MHLSGIEKNIFSNLKLKSLIIIIILKMAIFYIIIYSLQEETYFRKKHPRLHPHSHSHSHQQQQPISHNPRKWIMHLEWRKNWMKMATIIDLCEIRNCLMGSSRIMGKQWQAMELGNWKNLWEEHSAFCSSLFWLWDTASLWLLVVA